MVVCAAALFPARSCASASCSTMRISSGARRAARVNQVTPHLFARAATPDDVVGNRLYLAWGVGDDGILQIVDRKKLLPPPHGTWDGLNPDTPSNDELEAAQAGISWMAGNTGSAPVPSCWAATPPARWWSRPARFPGVMRRS